MEINHSGFFASSPLVFQGEKNPSQSFKPLEADTHADSVLQSVPAHAPTPGTQSGNRLKDDPATQRQLSELRARDQEVRAHELAHAAAAGGLSQGGPSFEYQRGPDGQQYAIGGEVQIDTSGVPGDPEATLEKAIQIQQAALAPAQPSAQDRSVAVAAAAMAAEARAELNSQHSGKTDEPDSQNVITRAQDAYRTASEAIQTRNAELINLTA